MTATTEAPPATAGGDPTIEAPPARKPRRRDLLEAVDWHQHPPGWTTGNIAAAVIATSMIAWRVAAPGWLAILAAVIGAIGAVAAGMIDNHNGARLWWRAACWLIPGAWSWIALDTTPFNPVMLAIGAGLAVAAGIMAHSIVAHRTTTDAATAAEVAAAVTGVGGIWQGHDTDLEVLAVNWVRRLKRVTGVEVEIPQIAIWDTGTGYTLECKIAKGGTGWRSMSKHGERLADDADLPHGCGVVGKPGRSRRWVNFDVAMENRLNDLHPIDDVKPRSAHNPIPTGVVPDGTSVSHPILNECTLVVGQTDSGKTNLLQVMNNRFGECVDVLLWHIDIGGGGGMARPWCLPYYEGRADKPVVDWVATTEEEAIVMLDAGIAIIESRKALYRDLMRQVNDEKVPISPHLPMIMIVTDEYAELPGRIRNKVIRIQNTGRGARVRKTTCGLRATSDVIEVPLKKQTRARYGMRVTDPEELNYLFGWSEDIDPDLAPYAGCGFVWKHDNGRKYLSPFRAYRITLDIIDDHAVKMAALRPALDEPSRKVANAATKGAYDTREARTYPLLFATAATITQTLETAEAPMDGEQASRAAEIARKFDNADAATGSLTDAVENMEAIAKNTKLPETWKNDFEELAAAIDPLSTDERSVMLGIIQDAREDGVTPAQIEQRLAERGIVKTRKTVHRWLTEELTAKTIAQPSGPRGPYVSRWWTQQ